MMPNLNTLCQQVKKCKKLNFQLICVGKFVLMSSKWICMMTFIQTTAVQGIRLMMSSDQELNIPLILCSNG